MSHKIKVAVQINGRNYTSPTNAARALAKQTAGKWAQPKYEDAVPRQSWNSSLYCHNIQRIEKRAYDRFLKVCKVLLK